MPSTDETATSRAPRTAAYAQEGITDPTDETRHMVAYVTEGEAGYQPTTYTGTLDYCRDVAESINQARGHTADDVLAIIASSFAAQSHDLDDDDGAEEEADQHSHAQADADEQRTRELQADAVRAAARRHALFFGQALDHQLTRAWLRDQADAIANGHIEPES